MNHKLSIYNNIYKQEDEVYIWNSYSNALVKIDMPTLNELESESLDPAVREQLVTNGILVDEKQDEHKSVVSRTAQIIRSDQPESLVLVICPTLSCNYKCVYCFENGREAYCSMDAKTIELVKDFVSDKISSIESLKELRVTWFGGEPLMAYGTILILTKYFEELCIEHRLEYRASIITNGRYLSENIAKSFSSLKIMRTQISFDGTRDIYCKKKGASREDYDITVSNIVKASMYIDNLILRVNICDNAFDDAYNLVDELLGVHKLAGKIRISPACTIEGASEERQARYKVYAIEEARLRSYIQSKYGSGSYHIRIPCARGGVCTLASKNNYVIGPRGELYKCEHHVGRRNLEVGSIEGGDNLTRIKEHLELCDQVANKDKCKRCSIFPVCLGGCPNSQREATQNFDCESYKECVIRNAVLPRIRR